MRLHSMVCDVWGLGSVFAESEALCHSGLVPLLMWGCMFESVGCPDLGKTWPPTGKETTATLEIGQKYAKNTQKIGGIFGVFTKTILLV